MTNTHGNQAQIWKRECGYAAEWVDRFEFIPELAIAAATRLLSVAQGFSDGSPPTPAPPVTPEILERKSMELFAMMQSVRATDAAFEMHTAAQVLMVAARLLRESESK